MLLTTAAHAAPPRPVPPLPPPHPDRGARPEAPPAIPPAAVAAPALRPAEPDPKACLDRVAKLGLTLKPAPAISDGACGAKHVFEVSALPSGIKAEPAAQVGCAVAEALARWVSEVVVPEARTHLARAPRSVLIGTSYQCRGRNRVPGATLSEHGFANAVDIMGFTFATGPAIPVKVAGGDTPEGRFSTAVRSRACAYFTTVLGPGSDAAHADHLHLDMRERKGGYRICQ